MWVNFFFLVFVSVNSFYTHKKLFMKKVLMLSLFSLFSLAIYAADQKKYSKNDLQSGCPNFQAEVKRELNLLSCTSSSSVERGGVTITCIATRETCQAADIAVSDCIIDILFLMPE